MSGSEEQYRTASRFRDNYVDPARNNDTYLALQGQGFQNQADNIAKMGELNARAEETIPGAITNAFRSYQGGVDRARKQGEQDQVMRQREGQITQTGLTNEQIPVQTEGMRIGNTNQIKYGTGLDLNNQGQALTNEEARANAALNNKVGANGLTNRETGYNAGLANTVLQPKLTQSGIDSNYGNLGLNRQRFDFDKSTQQRSEEGQDYEAAVRGILSSGMTPVEQSAAIDRLNTSGEFGHIRASTLPGKVQGARYAVDQGKIANHTAKEISQTSLPGYQDLRQTIQPISEKLAAVDQMRAELARYQANSRAFALTPGMENTDANSARVNLADLADKVAPGLGAKVREQSVTAGVEDRLKAAIAEAARRVTGEFKAARVHPDYQNRPEYQALAQKVQELGVSQPVQGGPQPLRLNPQAAAGAPSPFAQAVNGPPQQQTPVQGSGPIDFSQLGTPYQPPGRR